MDYFISVPLLNEAPEYPLLKLHSVVCNFGTDTLSFERSGASLPLWAPGRHPPFFRDSSIITLRCDPALRPSPQESKGLMPFKDKFSKTLGNSDWLSVRMALGTHAQRKIFTR